MSASSLVPYAPEQREGMIVLRSGHAIPLSVYKEICLLRLHFAGDIPSALLVPCLQNHGITNDNCAMAAGVRDQDEDVATAIIVLCAGLYGH